MCEALKEEPNFDDLPITADDFFEETVLALQIYEFLKDCWLEMSGVYLGKDYALLPFLLEHYSVQDYEKDYVLYIIRVIDQAVAQDIKKKQKAAEAASKSKHKRA
jgi:hypothetical protein